MKRETRFSVPKSINAFYSRTYVDYDDIENPVKSILRGGPYMAIKPNVAKRVRFTLATHEFRDMPFRF